MCRGGSGGRRGSAEDLVCERNGVTGYRGHRGSQRGCGARQLLRQRGDRGSLPDEACRDWGRDRAQALRRKRRWIGR